MGVFDVGNNNCSSTGKFFNDALGIFTLGAISGPTEDECNKYKLNKILEVNKVIKDLNDTIRKQIVQPTNTMLKSFKPVEKHGLRNFIEKMDNTKVQQKKNESNISSFFSQYGIIIVIIVLLFIMKK
jgi:hypothetical protein